MADKIKLGEISKNLKITNKDIIAKLAEFGVELKSSASVVDEETIGLIFDIYTEMNQVSDEEIREIPLYELDRQPHKNLLKKLKRLKKKQR